MDNFMRLKGELEEAIDNYNETFATSGEDETKDIDALMDVVNSSMRLVDCLQTEKHMHFSFEEGMLDHQVLKMAMGLAGAYDAVIRIDEGKILIFSKKGMTKITERFYKQEGFDKLRELTERMYLRVRQCEE